MTDKGIESKDDGGQKKVNMRRAGFPLNIPNDQRTGWGLSILSDSQDHDIGTYYLD